MNKKVLICIGIIFLVIIFVLLKIVFPNIKETKKLELTYKTNAGVPYEWVYEIEDNSIVEFVETKETTSEENKKLLGPVYINYIFKGLKKGMTTITFKYKNIINGFVEKEDKITVKVDKYKNISLVVIS